jgi:peptidoglycan/xylan/chitin deacetylase (PgdA/CDA1 family)
VRLPALLYHHIGHSRPGTFPELTVSPERFARHVRWLARRGYVGIRPGDWLAWRREGKSLPRRPVLLTFDDAYADLAEHALPVLEKYGFGGAVFVVTGRIGDENRWDQVRGSGRHRLMTARQIREWTGRGIEFGAHSRTHPDLTTLSNQELNEEIRGSRDDLAAVTGMPVMSFAYPFGRMNEAVHECVRSAFDCAFSCQQGVNTDVSDSHSLCRNMVHPGDSALAVACRTRFGRYPVQEWRARLRIRSRFKAAAAWLPHR